MLFFSLGTIPFLSPPTASHSAQFRALPEEVLQGFPVVGSAAALELPIDEAGQVGGHGHPGLLAEIVPLGCVLDEFHQVVLVGALGVGQQADVPVLVHAGGDGGLGPGVDGPDGPAPECGLCPSCQDRIDADAG